MTTTANYVDRLIAIANRLNAVLTVHVSVEHPGVLHVPHCDRCELAYVFGTANGSWQGDLQDAHGRYMGETLSTLQPVGASHVMVARAIVLALERGNPLAHSAAPGKMPFRGREQVTYGQLRDIVSRAQSVIQESDGADEHRELLADLQSVTTLIDLAIGSSHMGCGKDVPMLDLGEPEDPALDIERPDGTTPTERRQRADGTWTYSTPEWDAKWHWTVGTRVRLRGGSAEGVITKANSVTVNVRLDDGRTVRAYKDALTRL